VLAAGPALGDAVFHVLLAGIGILLIAGLGTPIVAVLAAVAAAWGAFSNSGEMGFYILWEPSASRWRCSDRAPGPSTRTSSAGRALRSATERKAGGSPAPLRRRLSRAAGSPPYGGTLCDRHEPSPIGGITAKRREATDCRPWWIAAKLDRRIPQPRPDEAGRPLLRGSPPHYRGRSCTFSGR
jgi:hypothetical protein